MAFPRLMCIITLLAILLFQTNYGYSQQKYFMGLPVDTVEISSSSGSYHFDHAGTTTGIRDSYVIAFDKESRKYFTKYKRTHIKLVTQPETAEYKAGPVQTESFDNQNALDSLFVALSVRYKALSIDQLGLSESEMSRIISKKRILKITKTYKQHSHLKREYPTMREKEQMFRGCKNIDTLKLFLDSYKVDTSNRSPIVSDYWDEIHIRIICGNKVFSFEGKYPNTLKLPWHFRSNSMYIRPIFNFDINKYLVAVLPPNFYRKNTIDSEALLNTYIVWYLHQRGIIRNDNLY